MSTEMGAFVMEGGYHAGELEHNMLDDPLNIFDEALGADMWKLCDEKDKIGYFEADIGKHIADNSQYLPKFDVDLIYSIKCKSSEEIAKHFVDEIEKSVEVKMSATDVVKMNAAEVARMSAADVLKMGINIKTDTGTGNRVDNSIYNGVVKRKKNNTDNNTDNNQENNMDTNSKTYENPKTVAGMRWTGLKYNEEGNMIRVCESTRKNKRVYDRMELYDNNEGGFRILTDREDAESRKWFNVVERVRATAAAKRTTVKDHISKMEDDVCAKNAEMASLKAEMASLKAEVASLTTVTVSLTAQNAQLTETIRFMNEFE